MILQDLLPGEATLSDVDAVPDLLESILLSTPFPGASLSNIFVSLSVAFPNRLLLSTIEVFAQCGLVDCALLKSGAGKFLTLSLEPSTEDRFLNVTKAALDSSLSFIKEALARGVFEGDILAILVLPNGAFIGG